MQKDKLRLLFAKRRSALSASEVLSDSRKIVDHCLDLDIWNKSNYHIFLSMTEKHEVDTATLIEYLFKLKKQIAVPRMIGKGKLEHVLLNPNSDIKPNKWGVPEPIEGAVIDPATLDVVFVPLLAYDRKGYRVGYGGGYYDNFLKLCREDIIRVGLSFFEPVAEIKDVYAGDIPLNFVVSPSCKYEFNV
jgi:5-formyltetrahydrofolate cyclo-ligase